ncbi:hypothetical protein PAXINDRAFT_20626 [Paxillus involutus ATCC 200175]|uniref:Protein kinase domain-containing protein n=1 Tax=Paxillus involutus ATCC 200175 TaxID=664439 RepID=A0A0C9SMH2_PAXIN|nr:hypothetical protein PAXINDRAFT_20626 [Paxillus involutus ATCC 200175]
MLGLSFFFKLFCWPRCGFSTTTVSEEEAKPAKDEEDDNPEEQSHPSAVLMDMTSGLSKQNDLPMVYGKRGAIWKCTFGQYLRSYEVIVESPQPQYNIAEEQLCLELKARAQLKHENILPLLGVATDFGPLTAAVYPWMENGTLTSYLQCDGGQLSLHDRLELLKDVAAGLCYLHSRSIVHGELTGHDIFVSASGTAQLSGFGFSGECIPEELPCRLRWAAPESFIPIRYDSKPSPWAPTEQSDVYSLGSVMLQVCSGEVPYVELKYTIDIVIAYQNGRTPWMNDRMWDFIQWCWSTEGAKRPSAKEALNFIQEEIVLSYLRLLPFFDESPTLT